MKRRVRKIANFFAFNLLFFALYLNFVHRDKAVSATGTVTNTEAFSGAGIVDNTNPAPVQKTDAAVVVNKKEVVKTQPAGTALRLSIN